MKEEPTTKERSEESVAWNDMIQTKFDEKIKYKTNIPVRALIGDYHDGSAPFTNSVLRKMGVETEIVPTARDVIDRETCGGEYEIIITNNVYSNGEKGQMVLDALKKEEKTDIPIVILTVDPDARDRYLRKGFDEYIQKPISEEKVIEVFPRLIKGLRFTEIG